MKDSLFILRAAEAVAGSKTLAITSNHTILVDCGFFQGKKELRERNWQALPVFSFEIDFILLTHAHLYHFRYLSRLIKDGFNRQDFF